MFLFTAIPPYDIVQIDSDNDEVSDTVSGKSCYIAALYSNSYVTQISQPIFQKCTYIFGTAVCCSGLINEVLTDTCAIYDCFDRTAMAWKTIQDLPSIFRNHNDFAHTVIREKGRDVGWLLSGGECKYSTAYQGIHIIVWFSKIY